MIASGPDLLRLLVLPAFAYVAISDLRTRRVAAWIWYPIAVVGIVALIWEATQLLPATDIVFRLWFIRVAISILIIAPLGVVFWWVGAFGLADAKALITIAVVFPIYPQLALSGYSLPLVSSDVGVFSLTILLNAVLVGLCYPLALAARNSLEGRFDLAMFVGIPVHWSDLETQHGRLLEGVAPRTRHGVDLDAMRMYLEWRGCSLEEIRSDPTAYRDPDSAPTAARVLGDGRVRTDGAGSCDDPWGARRFLEQADNPYGTRPEELRAALSLLGEREHVWVSPGIPFLVPVGIGLVIAVIYGDVATGLLFALT